MGMRFPTTSNIASNFTPPNFIGWNLEKSRKLDIPLGTFKVYFCAVVFLYQQLKWQSYAERQTAVKLEIDAYTYIFYNNFTAPSFDANALISNSCVSGCAYACCVCVCVCVCACERERERERVRAILVAITLKSKK